MADAQSSYARFLNPWVLHLQKLGLELKCPSCLNLYKRPVLLPCDHIFCDSCVARVGVFGLGCSLCKQPYLEQDLRQVPFMENIVNIYRSLDAAVSMHMLQPANTMFCDQSAKVPADGSPMCNSASRRSMFTVLGNKRVQVPQNCLGVENPGNGSGSNIDNMLGGEIHPSERAIGHNQFQETYVEMNQASQLSPDSPPSSGGDNTTAEQPIKQSGKRTADEFVAEQMHEAHLSYLKKPKQLDKGLFENHGGQSPSSTDTTPSDPNLMNFTCGFCHSWKITEGSGPMMHYANGKPVVADEAASSNVIHVHKKCIEWAPQIYFQDEIVKNLEKELLRGAKLKCAKCKLTGAALGCFAKTCRRSYHVPCAYQIPGCRWDNDDFLMLCPVHSSSKFPNEKLKKCGVTKCSTTHQINSHKPDSHESNFWTPSPSGAKDWVLCGSALSASDKNLLVKFASMCGATISKSWNPNVTHVIAATDVNGACSRTLKFLMAIVKGRWILTIDWVKASMESRCPVDEEPYEVCLDNHGCSNGPKTGRLRVLNNAPKLFSGLNLLFHGDFAPTYKEDLQELIIAAGGIILESKEQLEQQCDTKENFSRTLVVYNHDGLQGTSDVSDALRQSEAQTVAARTRSHVIPHTWLLDSIASCTLKPFA